MKHKIEQINSIAKDMKYEALYWALGFEETEKGIFEKTYGNLKSLKAEINLHEQFAIFPEVKITDGKLFLKTHESFVVLECLDKLLSVGTLPEKISVDGKNNIIRTSKYLIKCFEWNNKPENFTEGLNKFQINYSSRLVSGCIERKTSKHIKGFETEGLRAEKYLSNSKIIRIPEGVTSLPSGLFWDNQLIEKVILPESLVNLGGDTFYNCKNLRSVTITKNVSFMGNNPFAGCPKLVLKNESENFHFENGALYSKDFSRLICFQISNPQKEFVIDGRTKIIGKHAFFLSNNLKKITVPSSVIKFENNPFSGCENLEIENHSSRYRIIDGVIYDSDLTSVTGCLNSIQTECLVLQNVKRICRNSFWNCKGIKKIILPESLEQIGYNPFVGCSEIEFISKSPNFIVENGILLNQNKSKIICCPSKIAKGEFFIPESVISLERGAFSGCENLTSIHLHNVSIISKTCFTNCNSLQTVYCPDLVSYIGEWAFAHCKNLKEISVFKECFIEKNVILNSPAELKVRQNRENYVIESDNLFTLSSMQVSYKNSFDSILIDPPYNSHIDYIGYKDGEFSGGYRNFIFQRVKLCSEILNENGFLVVNIDEGGLSDIESVCKEIFGEKNVSVKKWKKKHPYFDKNRVEKNPNKKQTDFEYIVFARKSAESKLNKIMQPYLDGEILKEKSSDVPEIFDCFGTNSSAKDEIKEIFGERDYFSTPKPVKLMKELVRATTKKDSVVLDFFAGSGTTGHAVTELNREDGGNRKFILVSNSESNICRAVTMERMKKIGAEVVELI